MDNKASSIREIIKKMKKNLECAICLDLLSDPYSSQCNHAFCRGCISTVISSSKHPRCPLCKKPISRRSIHENSRLADIVEAVQRLELAVLADTGLAGTPPPSAAIHSHESTGTPGMILHSLLHPTPTKPGPSMRRAQETSNSFPASDGEANTQVVTSPLSRRRKKRRSYNLRKTAPRSSKKPLSPFTPEERTAVDHGISTSCSSKRSISQKNRGLCASITSTGSVGEDVADLGSVLNTHLSNGVEGGQREKVASPSLRHQARVTEDSSSSSPRSEQKVGLKGSDVLEESVSVVPCTITATGDCVEHTALLSTERISGEEVFPLSSQDENSFHLSIKPNDQTASQHRTSLQSSFQHSTSVQPSSQHGTSVQPASQHGTGVQPASQHGTSVHPASQHGTSVHPASQHGTSVQPASQHSTSVQPASQHGTSVQPSSQHGTSVQPSSQHSTSVQPSSQHSTSVQPSSQHSTSVQPSSQHSTNVQLSSQHGTSVQPSSQHSTSVQPSSQHSTSVQLSSQHSYPIVQHGIQPVLQYNTQPWSQKSTLPCSQTNTSSSTQNANSPSMQGSMEPFKESGTPLSTQSTPVPSQSTLVPTQSTSIPTQSTPVPTQSTPVPTQSSPVPTQSIPVPTQNNPVPTQGSTLLVTQRSTPPCEASPHIIPETIPGYNPGGVLPTVGESPVIPLQDSGLELPTCSQKPTVVRSVFDEDRIESTPPISSLSSRSRSTIPHCLVGLCQSQSPQTWPKQATVLPPFTHTQPNSTAKQDMHHQDECLIVPTTPENSKHDQINSLETPPSSASTTSLETSNLSATLNESSLSTMSTNESFNTQDIEQLQYQLEAKKKEVARLNALLQTSPEQVVPTSSTSPMSTSEQYDEDTKSKSQKDTASVVCEQESLCLVGSKGGEDCRTIMGCSELKRASSHSASLSPSNDTRAVFPRESTPSQLEYGSNKMADHSSPFEQFPDSSPERLADEVSSEDDLVDDGSVVSIVELCDGKVLEKRGVLTFVEDCGSQDLCDPVCINTPSHQLVGFNTIPPHVECFNTIPPQVECFNTPPQVECFSTPPQVECFNTPPQVGYFSTPPQVGCSIPPRVEHTAETFVDPVEEPHPESSVCGSINSTLDCDTNLANPSVIPSTFKTQIPAENSISTADIENRGLCDVGSGGECPMQGVVDMLEVSVIRDSLPLATQQGPHPQETTTASCSPSLLGRRSSNRVPQTAGRPATQVGRNEEVELLSNSPTNPADDGDTGESGRPTTLESSPTVLGETQDVGLGGFSVLSNHSEETHLHRTRDRTAVGSSDQMEESSRTTSASSVPNRSSENIPETPGTTDKEDGLNGTCDRLEERATLEGPQSCEGENKETKRSKGLQSTLSFIKEAEKVIDKLTSHKDTTSPMCVQEKSIRSGVSEPLVGDSVQTSSSAAENASLTSRIKEVTSKSHGLKSLPKKRYSDGGQSPSRPVLRPIGGWCSSRKRSRAITPGNSSSKDTPTAHQETKKTNSKKKFLPEFWQPLSDKKKRLDFINSITTSGPEAANVRSDKRLKERDPVASGWSTVVQQLQYSEVVPPGLSNYQVVPPDHPNCKVVPPSLSMPAAKKKHSLVASALGKDQMKCLQAFVTTFKVRWAGVFNSCTTHVVISTDENKRCLRTVKYLQGLAAGKWILDYSWVEASLDSGFILPEDKFEVAGDSLCSHGGAPKRARQSRSLLDKGLFEGHTLGLHGTFHDMSKEQLSQILKLSGATVVSGSAQKDMTVICDPHYWRESPDNDEVPRHNTIVSVNWIINSLSDYKVQPVESYVLRS